ncbi:hypothetical protein H072_10404 [Dactylellina haptotyla CBS 200.50]|uniref:Uncharacterized protein n=1 Tax=Dactylellina haptotyla (strain CBS 200.50) TaxID=1284197 RepID=S7ZZ33_DACHA|nr:hypothetical protein H072_10404 [Dactylellina haptotyla CBS 200.50]
MPPPMPPPHGDDDDEPPPPPPRHDSNAKTTSGTPPKPPPHQSRNPNLPDTLDVFVIPSGGGVLYLPSLSPHRNSFVAGSVTTVSLEVVWIALRFTVGKKLGGWWGNLLVSCVLAGLVYWITTWQVFQEKGERGRKSDKEKEKEKDDKEKGAGGKDGGAAGSKSAGGGQPRHNGHTKSASGGSSSTPNRSQSWASGNDAGGGGRGGPRHRSPETPTPNPGFDEDPFEAAETEYMRAKEEEELRQAREQIRKEREEIKKEKMEAEKLRRQAEEDTARRRDELRKERLESERLRKQAEEDAARRRDELRKEKTEAEKLRKQVEEDAARKRDELKKEREEAERIKRQAEEAAALKRKEVEEVVERKKREADELTEKKRKEVAEERRKVAEEEARLLRIKREEKERRRKLREEEEATRQRLDKEEEARRKKLREEELSYKLRLADEMAKTEEERLRKLEETEESHKRRLAEESAKTEAERKKRLEEEEERRNRLLREEEERRNRLQQEEKAHKLRLAEDQAKKEAEELAKRRAEDVARLKELDKRNKAEADLRKIQEDLRKKAAALDQRIKQQEAKDEKSRRDAEAKAAAEAEISRKALEDSIRKERERLIQEKVARDAEYARQKEETRLKEKAEFEARRAKETKAREAAERERKVRERQQAEMERKARERLEAEEAEQKRKQKEELERLEKADAADREKLRVAMLERLAEAERARERVAAEAAVEKRRLEAIQKEEEEKERLRLENEKLKQQLEAEKERERQRAEAEKEKERQRLEAEEAARLEKELVEKEKRRLQQIKEREERDRQAMLATLERDRERERKAREALEREIAEAAAKEQEEREKREKEAEEERERQRIESLRRERERDWAKKDIEKEVKPVKVEVWEGPAQTSDIPDLGGGDTFAQESHVDLEDAKSRKSSPAKHRHKKHHHHRHNSEITLDSVDIGSSVSRRPRSPTKTQPPEYVISSPATQRSKTKRQPKPAERDIKPMVEIVDDESEYHTLHSFDAQSEIRSHVSGSSGVTARSKMSAKSAASSNSNASKRKYSTSDPDKIVLKAVYIFTNEHPKKPQASLIAGVGGNSEGLVLNISTAGLFIDDELNNSAQREWDQKAWAIKDIEVYCPRCIPPAAPSGARAAAKQTVKHLLSGSTAPSAAEQEKYLDNLGDVCRSHCANKLQASRDRDDSTVTGNGNHLIRANLGDTDDKKVVYVFAEDEGWKVPSGLMKLKNSPQVRQLVINVFLFFVTPAQQLKMPLISTSLRRWVFPIILLLHTTQALEQLYYLKLQPLDIPSLQTRPAGLLDRFYEGGEDVYIKEQVLEGDIVGLIEIGNPANTSPPDSLIELEEYTGSDLNDKIDDEYIITPPERSFFKVRKNGRGGGAGDGFTVEFMNGHKFGQWPMNGLPYAWAAGDEAWMKGLKLVEPVFIEGEDGRLTVKGMAGWDIFACEIIPAASLAGVDDDTQIFWEIISIQRAVWGQTKIDKISGRDPRCIPVSVSLQDTMMVDAVAPVQMALEENMDINQYMTDLDGPAPVPVAASVFGSWDLDAASNAMNEALQSLQDIDITDEDGEDGYLTPQGRRTTSRYLSQGPNSGSARGTILEVADIMEEDDWVPEDGEMGMSEQADNSQEDDHYDGPLVLPDGSDVSFSAPDEVVRAGSTEPEGGGWEKSGITKYWSTGDLYGDQKGANGVDSLGVRGTRSEDVEMLSDQGRFRQRGGALKD